MAYTDHQSLITHFQSVVALACKGVGMRGWGTLAFIFRSVGQLAPVYLLYGAVDWSRQPRVFRHLAWLVSFYNSTVFCFNLQKRWLCWISMQNSVRLGIAYFVQVRSATQRSFHVVTSHAAHRVPPNNPYVHLKTACQSLLTFSVFTHKLSECTEISVEFVNLTRNWQNPQCVS